MSYNLFFRPLFEPHTLGAAQNARDTVVWGAGAQTRTPRVVGIASTLKTLLALSFTLPIPVPAYKNVIKCRAVVARAFNASTWEAETGGFLN